MLDKTSTVIIFIDCKYCVHVGPLSTMSLCTQEVDISVCIICLEGLRLMCSCTFWCKRDHQLSVLQDCKRMLDSKFWRIHIGYSLLGRDINIALNLHAVTKLVLFISLPQKNLSFQEDLSCYFARVNVFNAPSYVTLEVILVGEVFLFPIKDLLFFCFK